MTIDFLCDDKTYDPEKSMSTESEEFSFEEEKQFRAMERGSVNVEDPVMCVTRFDNISSVRRIRSL